MPRKLSKICVEPKRRSARIRAREAPLDPVINLVSDEEGGNTRNAQTRVPMPIVVSNSCKSTVWGSGSVKRELVEDNATVNETDDASTKQTNTNTNPMECDDTERESGEENSEGELNLVDQLQKDESQNVLRNILNSEAGSSSSRRNVNAGAQPSSSTETPVAERHSLIRTMGNASLRQDCTRNRHGNLGEKEGPVLLLRQTAAQSPLNKNQGVLLQPPTISEMLIPRTIQNPSPFEQRQIDLQSQDKNKHLRRSASRDWSRGSPEPEPRPSRSRSFERFEVPPKRVRLNEECGPLQRLKVVASPPNLRFDEHDQPSCSYHVDHRQNWNYQTDSESEYDEYSTAGDYDTGSSSVLTTDNNNQSVRTSKSCAKVESVQKPQVKLKKHKSKTVCKSCGGIGHRNILDDHLKDTISRKLAKFRLANEGRFSN